MNLPQVAPVALRLVIGTYVSQRETSYLKSRKRLFLLGTPRESFRSGHLQAQVISRENLG
jgi:hypothetical protein